MIDIEKPKIEIAEISDDNRYGKFICEPLERGYGTTFGNSLRRMLLSSLEGAAVTSIRIEGVLHEFSTIPGVRDDVTNIVLNLVLRVFMGANGLALATSAAGYVGMAALLVMLKRRFGNLGFGRIVPERLIDIGCGPGAFLSLVEEMFPRIQLNALDLSEAMIHETKERLSAY